jgi:hypothetical protein
MRREAAVLANIVSFCSGKGHACRLLVDRFFF